MAARMAIAGPGEAAKLLHHLFLSPFVLPFCRRKICATHNPLSQFTLSEKIVMKVVSEDLVANSAGYRITE